MVIRACSDILPARVNPAACHTAHKACDTAYDLDPHPPDLEPYVGSNGLAHLINCPHEAEDEGNHLPIQDVWLKRFPKKEKTKLTACPPYQFGLGWGIEFREEWHMNWLMKLTLSALLIAAIVFLVCWWVKRGDLQGASGMAALLVALAALTLSQFSIAIAGG